MKVVSIRAIYIANFGDRRDGDEYPQIRYHDDAVQQILLRLEITPPVLLCFWKMTAMHSTRSNFPERNVNVPAEQRVPGGLGIYLVRKLTGEVNCHQHCGRNRLPCPALHLTTSYPVGYLNHY